MEKPETFSVAIRGKVIHVKRHFEFTSGVIDLDINFTPTTGEDSLTVKQMHQASLRVAIQYLQKMLDASEKASAASPGQ